MAPPRKDLAHKLWSTVDVRGPEDCWLSTRRVSSNGYVTISHGKKKQYAAHRLSFELTYGPIPEGLLVRHKCDVKHCCNPYHLELGTQKDNMRDRKERRPGGYGGGRKPYKDIGDKYGV